MRGKILFFVSLILIWGVMTNGAGAVPVIIGFEEDATFEHTNQEFRDQEKGNQNIQEKGNPNFRKANDNHILFVQKHKGVVKRTYKYISAVAADVPEEEIENISRNDAVSYIEPDHKVKALAQTLPWGVDRIDAEKVHATGNKGSGVNVAIIDTGLYYNHPDLNANYAGGWDFVNGDSDPTDDHWHGTHCAGTIAAEDNSEGVIGVAPEASLYSLKVLDRNGNGNTNDVVAAIEWAIDTINDGDSTNNIKIISMSLGSDSTSQTMENACNLAYNSGILLVAAAGNSDDGTGTVDTVGYPGKYESVIAIAATDSSNSRASFSSVGEAVELAAPGQDIYSTSIRVVGWKITPTYGTASGTSMACPHAAGTAALVWSEHPDWTNDQIRSKLQETATDLGDPGRDTWFGYGLIDAELAVGDSTPDIIPPVISNVNSFPDVNSAIITWDTDENSDSTVRYSTNADLSEASENTDSTPTVAHQIEITGLASGTTYYFEVKSTDAAGNTATEDNGANYYSFTTTVEQDTTAPVISNVNSVPDVNSAAITWNTDENSDSTVRYSTNADLSEASENTDSTLTVDHQIGITELVPETTYYFEVQSTDAAGNTATEDNGANYYTFTTKAETSVNEMHIGDILMSLETRRIFVRAKATVRVENENKQPVEGVSIKGIWSGNVRGTASGTTDSNGEVTFNSRWTVRGRTFTFTVDDAQKDGWVYNSAENEETSDTITA